MFNRMAKYLDRFTSWKRAREQAAEREYQDALKRALDGPIDELNFEDLFIKAAKAGRTQEEALADVERRLNQESLSPMAQSLDGIHKRRKQLMADRTSIHVKRAVANQEFDRQIAAINTQLDATVNEANASGNARRELERLSPVKMAGVNAIKKEWGRSFNELGQQRSLEQRLRREADYHAHKARGVPKEVAEAEEKRAAECRAGSEAAKRKADELEVRVAELKRQETIARERLYQLAT